MAALDSERLVAMADWKRAASSALCCGVVWGSLVRPKRTCGLL